MDWNKEEALRAKEIAERKMHNRDFIGARKVARKAQQLFPDLENVAQMLSVCDIHCSAEIKAGGAETDWYAILQVELAADEAAIRKQFRKLALLLHPDKNKFPGAEAAFKLIGEAQQVLLDPRKRTEHDIKRKATVYTGMSTQVPANRNAYSRSRSSSHGHSVNQGNTESYLKNQTQYPGMMQQQEQALDAFWTVCPFCNIRYQYYRNIMNRALRCQNCMKPFIAYDMNMQGGYPGNIPGYQGNQSSVPKPSAHIPGYQENQSSIPKQTSQTFDAHTTAPSMPSNMGFQWKSEAAANHFSQAAPAVDVGNAAKNKTMEDGHLDEKAGKKVKIDNVKVVCPGQRRAKSSVSASKRKGRKTVMESSESSSHSADDEEVDISQMDTHVEQDVSEGAFQCPRRSARPKQDVMYKEQGSEDEEYEKPHILKRLKKRKLHNDTSSGGEACKGGDTMTDPAFYSGADREKELSNDNKELMNDEKISDRRKVEVKNDKYEGMEERVFISYDEPEFYDFNQDRAENKFRANQVWALYDDQEGMPRFYARIKRVFAPKFKIQFSWLEPSPVGEDEVKWCEKELPVACGTFRTSYSETTDSLQIFSHLVTWEKGAARGLYKIFPREGDVWALFKGWDISWISNPELHGKFGSEIVEVLSDFSSESGIEVTYLVKVKGFTSIFQHVKSEGTPFRIPCRELLRFSHRIPSYKMSGMERKGVPKGCYELDPASVPLGLDDYELFQASGDVVEEIEIVDTEEVGSHSGQACANQMLGKQNSMTPTSKWSGDRHEKAGTEGQQESMKLDNQNHPIYGGDSPDDLCKGEANGVLEHGVIGSKHQVNVQEDRSFDGMHSPCYSGDAYVLPDSEFHSFETDKSVEKFQKGQFWALYSDEDGMPKYYARVEKSNSLTFHVQVQWLEACASSEEEVHWSREGLPLGCGIFKLTKSFSTYENSESFSHLVHAIFSLKKARFEIWPGEGEVWAVYENWRPGWSMADLVDCEYEIVQIVSTESDYKVRVLEKMEGYRCVFSVGEEKNMPRQELIRFSHRIPSFCLTEESGGKLRGCLELDPASLPAHLLFTSPS